MATPIVLISTDVRVADGYRWHATPQTYLDAVREGAGVIPLELPNLDGALDLDGLLGRVDGVVMTGSRSNVHPANYGAEPSAAHEPYDEDRDRMSFELVRKALAKRIPVLSICRGMQELNVALGGTLIQHIPDAIKNALAHEQPNPRNEPGHTVAVKAGTRLRQIVGTDTLPVNSAHHQAAKGEPAGVVINAVAPDGVIEGIEAAGRRFCIGVQWHPEFAISEGDVNLFAAFVAAAQRDSGS